MAYIEWEKEEEAFENAKRFGITDSEINECLNYVRFSDTDINSLLKGFSSSIEDENDALKRIPLLYSAINKLPRLNSKIVYRREEFKILNGDKLDLLDREDSILWFIKNQNKLIKYPNFLSSRHSKPPIEDKILLVIHTNEKTNSREFFKLYDGEDEVLFVPNTFFVIDSINQTDYIVTLKEVDNQNKESAIEMNFNFFQ